MSDQWEIDIRSFLNGLEPDIVLLNPDVSLAVFEVCDWDLQALLYPKSIEQSVLDNSDTKGISGYYTIPPTLEECQHLWYRILGIKEEIYTLYAVRRQQRSGFAAMTVGMIFPNSHQDEEDAVFKPIPGNYKQTQGVRKYTQSRLMKP